MSSSVVALHKLERVAQLTAPVVRADEMLHPVDARLQAILPWAGLKKGSVIETRSRSLGWLLVAEAAKAGAWIAMVGVPSPSWAAAVELGVPLDRIAVISTPAVEIAGTVLAALVDAVELVLVDPSVNLRPHELRKLIARAKERRSVLISFGEVGPAWEGVDVRLSITASRWHGLGDGHGALTGREVEIEVTGRGAAMRPKRTTLWLQGAEQRWAEPAQHKETGKPTPEIEVDYPQEVQAAASA
jgi:hypothetical protein